MSETETETPATEDAPEQPEQPDPNEHEDEQEPEQSARTAAQRDGSDALLKRADAENRKYHKRLDTILGDDPSRHECPTCNGLGVTWGDAPAEPDLVHPDNLVTCEACNGYGLVVTGSNNPDHITAICTACSAMGYIVKAAPVAVVAQLPTAAPVAGQVLQGQYIPGKGFVPYGQDDALPGTLGI